MKLILLAFTILTFSACLSTLNRKLDLSSPTPYIDSVILGNKKIIFLGIRHIGTKAYYENIRNYVALHVNMGFKFFVESMGTGKDGNLIYDTTALKKVRKLLNVDVSVQYADNTNAIMEALVKKYQLVNQPKYSELSVKEFSVLDIPYPLLLDDFESDNGEVILDSCDIKTSLGSSYTCISVPKEVTKRFKQQYIFEKRDQFVAKSLENLKDSNIFLIFGRDHIKNIKKFLLE